MSEQPRNWGVSPGTLEMRIFFLIVPDCIGMVTVNGTSEMDTVMLCKSSFGNWDELKKSHRFNLRQLKWKENPQPLQISNYCLNRKRDFLFQEKTLEGYKQYNSASWTDRASKDKAVGWTDKAKDKTVSWTDRAKDRAVSWKDRAKDKGKGMVKKVFGKGGSTGGLQNGA
ncbi:hypothetical protein C8R42DRAFT_670654 [Lentinula raphanica]|nr:hypothetical protein C8R42DRAFT_670654 [Lentinula raphanica]